MSAVGWRQAPTPTIPAKADHSGKWGLLGLLGLLELAGLLKRPQTEVRTDPGWLARFLITGLSCTRATDRDGDGGRPLTGKKDTKKPAPEVSPAPRDVPAPRAETHDAQPGTSVTGVPKGTHDVAIEEAVEGIHG